MRPLPERLQDVEVGLLEHLLQRGGDVVVVARELGVGGPGGAEGLDHPVGEDPPDRRRPLVPGHVDALLVVQEVVEAELEHRPVELHELAHLVEVARLAVGREAHHLALVAVVREAEPLRDRGVEDPERVRVEDALEHLELVAVALGEHRRGEVAEAVDGEDRGVLERRDEERARDVRLVVLDVVEAGGEGVRLDPEPLRERRADVADARRVLEAGLEVAGARAVADRAQQLLAEVRLRVARDGDVVELLGLQARVGEAPRGGQRREAGAVLDAVETLLLGGCDELAVDDESCGRVTVEGVEPQDRGHRPPFCQSFVAELLGARRRA